MGQRFRFQWLIGALVVAMMAAVAAYTYNVGVAHGIAQSARVVAPEGGGPVVAYWPRPWGFGFGFFPFFPLLFILFWFAALRGLFWRGAWHRGGYRYGGYGYRGGPPCGGWEPGPQPPQTTPPAGDVKA